MSMRNHHSNEPSKVARARDDELKADVAEAIKDANNWDEVRARLLRKHRALFESSRITEEDK